MASEYLKRQPTSTGNRKVFTWSGWVKTTKESKSGNGNDIFFCASSNDTGSTVYHRTRIGKYVLDPHDFGFNHYDGANDNYASDAVFRDFSSWSHYICSVDTTKDQSTDRIRLYVNGVYVQDLNTVTAINQNLDTFVNGLTVHYLGADGWTASPNSIAKLSMFDVFLVDGQALTPDVFGFYKDGDGYMSSGTTQATDFRPGQWMPHSPTKIKKDINRRGGFGTNGFYLPMNDSSNPGADFHCDPNSIIKLKGEDLPQPRNGAPVTTDAYVSQLRTDPFAANLVLAVPGIGTLRGTETVSNGNFSDGTTTNWSSSRSATITNNSGVMRVTNGASSTSGAHYEITTESGKYYNITFDVLTGANNGYVGVSDSNVYSSGTFALAYAQYTNGSYSKVFQASGTSYFLHFHVYGGSSGNFKEFDNISVREVNAPTDYSADIKGSGTNKTLTPAGNAGVGYELGGYYGSAMNFPGTSTSSLATPSNSDFAFGTGDFTVEFWVKASSENTYHQIFDTRGTVGNSTTGFSIGYTSGNFYIYTNTFNIQHSVVLDEFAHLVVEREGSNLTLYINGVAVGLTSFNLDLTNSIIYIGATGTGDTSQYFNGNIQDLRVYKGLAKYKGGFDVPKPYTPVGIEAFRTTADTCKNNFATLNPLDAVTDNQSGTDYTQATHSNGNLTVILSDDFSSARGTIGMSSGKYYWEVRIDSNTNSPGLGVIAPGNQLTSYSSGSGGASYEPQSDRFRKNGVGHYDGTNNKTDDGLIVGVALDKDAGSISFYADGVLQSNGTMTGLNALSDVHIPECFTFNDGPTVDNTYTWNFGQNPTFSGQVTAGTNADDSGKGLFKYAPPTGFLALCEDNLPTPTIADPGDYMRTVLYTGTDSSRSVTGVGFKPDMVWIKSRSTNYWHQVFDTIRGPGNRLYTNETEAEDYRDITLRSFDNNGFSIGDDDGGINNGGDTYVAWCWKAGGAAVSNTDGDLTSQVSVNQDAGFSIVEFTGQGGSSSATVGHGLGKKPAFWIYKPYTNTSNWYMYHQSLGASAWLTFTTSQASTGNTAAWGGVEPTSTVLTHGAGLVNQGSCILYAWAEIEGYSKFGSFSGNSSTNGVFVYTGHRPAFVMIKRTDSTGNWVMHDNARNSTNPAKGYLLANSSGVEEAGSDILDFLSNGFKIRNSWTDINASGGSYVFASFAESPFKYANSK
jgi:hypothetical protein